MAESVTTRLGLPRWTADTDTPDRTEFDSAFSNLESEAAGYWQGLAASRPAAAAANLGFIAYTTDDDVVAYSDGTTWHPLFVAGSGLGSSGRTLNIGAANASIVVNVDNIQVGFDATTPAALTPDIAAATGSAVVPARRDHVHNVPAAAPNANLTASTTNAEGSASSFARSNHTHAITANVAASTILPDDAAAVGTNAALARADHKHAITTAVATGLSDASTNTEGAATSFARSDHTHAITGFSTTSHTHDSLYVNVTGDSMSGSLDFNQNAITEAVLAWGTELTGNTIIPGFFHNEMSNWNERGGATTETPTNVTVSGTLSHLTTPGTGGNDTRNYTPSAAGANVVLEYSGLSFSARSDGNGARLYVVSRAGNPPNQIKAEVKDGSGVWQVITDDTSPSFSGNVWVSGQVMGLTLSHQGVRFTFTWNASGTIWYLSEVGYTHKNTPMGEHAIPWKNGSQQIYGTWSFDNAVTIAGATALTTSAFDATAPVALTPDIAGAAGSSTVPARRDHVHNVPAAAPITNLTASTANAEGSGTSFARSDHTHAITANVAPAALTPDIAAAVGTNAALARADHVHNVPAATAVGLSNSSTSAEGTAASFARSDHTHAITGFASLSASNVFSASQQISKTAHAPGASAYHLELYSADTADSNNEVSLRFHQGGRYWAQLRYRSGGFRFTGGSDDTLVNTHVAEPTTTTHAATKNYVDNTVGGTILNTTIGDGIATSFTIIHNFNTQNVLVHVYDKSVTPWNLVQPTVENVDVNSIKLTFSTAPTASQYHVIVFGGAVAQAYQTSTMHVANVGDGTNTTINVQHNLNTTDILVQVYDQGTGDQVDTGIDVVDANNVSFTFATAPTANQYKAVIVGAAIPYTLPSSLYGAALEVVGADIKIANDLFFGDPGTAADPSITWDGDPSTGFYHPAANDIGIAIGGVDGYKLNATRFATLTSADLGTSGSRWNALYLTNTLDIAGTTLTRPSSGLFAMSGDLEIGNSANVSSLKINSGGTNTYGSEVHFLTGDTARASGMRHRASGTNEEWWAGTRYGPIALSDWIVGYVADHTLASADAERWENIKFRVASTGDTYTYGALRRNGFNGFSPLSFLNGWVNYGGTYATAGVYRSPDGMIHLKGLVKDGTAGVVANLPSNWRPTERHIHTVRASTGEMRVDVDPSGDITISGTLPTWISLSDIKFPGPEF